jgi:hypothetical protein
MIAVAGGLLTIIGLFLGPISRYLEKREANRLLAEQFQKMMEQHPEGAITFSMYRMTEPTPEPKPKGFLVLIIFAIIVGIFGLCTVAYFWSYLYNHLDKLIFAIWLFLTMVFGMFVQVLNEFYRAKQPLSQIEASHLLFPLLFSIVVFYAIWATVGSASHNFFSFYAAFLNGFFWETTVSQAKPPKPVP